MRIVSVYCLLFPLLAAGCATTGSVDTTDSTVTGAVSTAPAVPVQSADLFLGPVAARMDEQAKADYLAAQTAALDAGVKTAFDNDTIGAQGSVSVAPSSLASVNPDMECRRYSSVVWVLGSGRAVNGDACRQEGGAWQAMGYVAL